MAQKQFSITLDAYHRWALEQVSVVMGKGKSDLMQWAWQDWVKNHPDHVTDANARLADYRISPRGKAGQ